MPIWKIVVKTHPSKTPYIMHKPKTDQYANPPPALATKGTTMRKRANPRKPVTIRKVKEVLNP